MLSVVMLTGLLQQRNSNFEGVVRRKFAEVGHRFPQSGFSPVKRTNRWRNAVRATLQLEDFIQCCRSYTQAICCAHGFSL